MEHVWRDVQYGARMLVKSPGFLAVAVLTLALGIGANTAIFSVINAILLRPLPYDESDRLMMLTEWSEQVPRDELLGREPQGRARPEPRLRGARGLQRREPHPDRRGRRGRAAECPTGHLRDLRDPRARRRSSAAPSRRKRTSRAPSASSCSAKASGSGASGAIPKVVGKTLSLSGESLHGDRGDAEDASRELEERSTSSPPSCASRTGSAARTSAATIPGSTSSAA